MSDKRSEHEPLPRRMRVLQAIVEDYVASREPVGSKALVERHNLGVSSATVRNDMAELEEEGLIQAPYTSSGRIPTDQGYRVFVDRISEVRPLSSAEKRAIGTILESSEDLDEIMSRTVQMLSKMTQQVAVAQVPHLDAAVIRRIELVELSDVSYLVVLIMSSGRVDQRIVTLPEPLDETTVELEVVRQIFLKHLDGLNVNQAEKVLPAIQDAVPAAQSELARYLSDALQHLFDAGKEERILLAGTANLLRSQTDFGRSIGPVLEVLEEQVVLLKLLTEMEADVRGMSISIGSENTGSLSGTSVVAANYGPAASIPSKVGVVGPTRMDYPRSMAAVRAVAKYLSRILSES